MTNLSSTLLERILEPLLHWVVLDGHELLRDRVHFQKPICRAPTRVVADVLRDHHFDPLLVLS